MTEFKEKLIFNIMDKLQDEIFKNPMEYWNVYPQDLKNLIRRILMEELKDVVVIDRNKLKEKINVVNYAPFVLDIESPNAALVSRLHFMRWITPELIPMVDMDIIKDRFKDELIDKLEECDF